MGKKNYKNAWTLAECALALFILSLLILASVQTFKNKIPSNQPFAYAALRNLNRVANFIIEDEVGGERRLPEGFKTNTGNTDVELCWRMADVLSIIGDPNCSAQMDSGLVSFSTLTTDGQENFQATNLITYYGLEKAFDMCTETNDNYYDTTLTMQDGEGNTVQNPAAILASHMCSSDGGATESSYLMRGLATNGHPCNKTNVKVKDVFIDINGGPAVGGGVFGDDRFPVKIYNTGEVFPGTCVDVQEIDPEIDPDENPDTDDSVYTCAGYQIDSPLKANPACGDVTTNFMITSEPFAYNIYSIHLPTQDELDRDPQLRPDQRITRIVEREISFAEADCRARQNILTRGQCAALEAAYNLNKDCNKGECRSFAPLDGTNGNTYAKKEGSPTPVFIPVDNPLNVNCTGENNFCIIRQAKPISMGFMGLPY